jgi:hypothetical protein
MKKFTKLFIVSLSAITAFTACNKTTVTTSTSITGPSSMKLAYNNTNLAFNTCIALQSNVNGSEQLIISGYNVTKSQVSDNSFEIDLYADIDSIKVGQVFPASTIFEQPHSMSLFFFPDTTNAFVTQVAQPIGSVAITAVTSSEIRGTFSGGLFNSDDFEASTLIYTITNGSFTAKRE